MGTLCVMVKYMYQDVYPQILRVCCHYLPVKCDREGLEDGCGGDDTVTALCFIYLRKLREVHIFTGGSNFCHEVFFSMWYLPLVLEVYKRLFIGSLGFMAVDTFKKDLLGSLRQILQILTKACGEHIFDFVRPYRFSLSYYQRLILDLDLMSSILSVFTEVMLKIMKFKNFIKNAAWAYWLQTSLVLRIFVISENVIYIHLQS